MRIETTDAPSEADQATVLSGLATYNQIAPAVTAQPIAVWVRDEDDQVVGGLYGQTGARWFFIEYFWLPEHLRGSGTGAAVLRRAEEEAVARGCIGAWLDTFSFQAPGFYERQGYSAFGVLDDFPAGERRHFMSKRLDRAAG
ncbi:GNAT family N-acetyltransferase [uncultured Sphingomonas sp.]|uniref:GNAT family N-acetyltransferase n=1 Tax=uncultured Sphingomonas sp. TaxID=158754 RepID=UPI0035CADA01